MKDFQRIKRLPPYVFNVVGDLKKEARLRGEDIIDFGMGNPDQPPPKNIIDKLIETAKKPSNHRYSLSRGIPRLNLAISNWYKRKFNVNINPKTEAITTIGSKEGLAHLALATVENGDTVLVPNPAYPIHPYGFVIAGADIRHIGIETPESFIEGVKIAISDCWPKPKMMIVSFPCNPTGLTVDLDFFKQIVDIAKKNKIWVIHDLAYADITFDDYKAPSIMQVPNAKDVAVEFFTLSKSYNMPGWRVGFMVGNKTLVHALARIKSYLDYGLFTPIQVSAIEALNNSDATVQAICNMYKMRRDVLCQSLNNINWQVTPPKATMFVWVKIPEFYAGYDSIKFAKKLIIDAKVAVSPGLAFGTNGRNYLRFSLIENEQRIKQAARNIKKMLTKDGFYSSLNIPKKAGIT